MRNKIKPILDDMGKTRYWFWKEAGLSQATAYRLYDDPSYIPTGSVMDRICKALSIQPGEWIEYIPDEDVDK